MALVGGFLGTNREGHTWHFPLPGARAVAGEGPLMGVSWSGVRVLAGAGAVLRDSGQGLRSGSCGGR